MAIQRCLLQIVKTYKLRHHLQSNIRQTYCMLCLKYSTGGSSRKYTDRHEWVTIDKDIGTVGVSEYAQESLGDVVFAQLPDPGTDLKAGDECGALESVKAASEIYSPLSGTVTEKNKDVEDKPALINTSCYDKGWLFRLKIIKQSEINDLMTEEEYKKFLETDAEKPE
ncbi:glycine cleavage system H protein, mitochondrial [Bombyx mori]|uniref:Glycine cleavage system H protein n=1 Tax=Bombyx mori TaxID=7091 RepID=A0A8R2QUX3_BOMMO|nr:glycine cleavage system H protein, mitochondrial [Bombyx mori]